MAQDRQGYMAQDLGQAPNPAGASYTPINTDPVDYGKAAQIEGQSTAETLKFLGTIGATAYQMKTYAEAADEARRTMNRTVNLEQGWLGEAASTARTMDKRAEDITQFGPPSKEASEELQRINDAQKQNIISPARAQSEMAATLRRMIAANPGAATSIRAAFEQYSGRGDYDIQEYRRAMDTSAADAAAKAKEAANHQFYSGVAKGLQVPILNAAGEPMFEDEAKTIPALRPAKPEDVKYVYENNAWATPLGKAIRERANREYTDEQVKDQQNLAKLQEARGQSVARPHIQTEDIKLQAAINSVVIATPAINPNLASNPSELKGRVAALSDRLNTAFSSAAEEITKKMQEASSKGKTEEVTEYQKYLADLSKRQKDYIDTITSTPEKFLQAQKLMAEINNISIQEQEVHAKHLASTLKFFSENEQKFLLTEAGRKSILEGKNSLFPVNSLPYQLAGLIDTEIKARLSNSAALVNHAASEKADYDTKMKAYDAMMAAVTPQAAKQALQQYHASQGDVRKVDNSMITTLNSAASNVLKNVLSKPEYKLDAKEANQLFASAANFELSNTKLNQIDAVLSSTALENNYNPTQQVELKKDLLTRGTTWLFGDSPEHLPFTIRSSLGSSKDVTVKDGVLYVSPSANSSEAVMMKLRDNVAKANTLVSIQSKLLNKPKEEIAQQFVSKLSQLKPVSGYNRMGTAQLGAVDAAIDLSEPIIGTLSKIPGWNVMNDVAKQAVLEAFKVGKVVSSNKEERENNFLNLRLPGKEEFRRFETKNAAVVAYSKQLDRYIEGKTTGTPLTTVDEIVGTWNNEKEKGSMSKKGYLERIKKYAGFEPSDTISSKEDKAKLMYAMQFAEVGAERMSLKEIQDVLGK